MAKDPHYQHRQDGEHHSGRRKAQEVLLTGPVPQCACMHLCLSALACTCASVRLHAPVSPRALVAGLSPGTPCLMTFLAQPINLALLICIAGRRERRSAADEFLW